MRTKIIAALLFVVLIGTVSIYYALIPIKAEGVVAAKSITSELDGAVHTIIRFYETGVNTNINDWESLFPNTTKISEEVESELKTRIQASISGIRVYVDIKYLVSIRIEDMTMAYFVSREDFNKVDPGDTVKFKIVKFKILHKRDDIVRIIRVIG